MQPEFVVQTKNLCKAFAGKEVIHDCTMSVERGTIYGFWGKNGAGKTTVFKILLGLLKPTMGEVSVLGMDSSKNNLEVLRRTGSLIETPIFYEHLSMWSGNIRYLSGNRKPVSHLFRHTDFACNFILHFFSWGDYLQPLLNLFGKHSSLHFPEQPILSGSLHRNRPQKSCIHQAGCGGIDPLQCRAAGVCHSRIGQFDPGLVLTDQIIHFVVAFQAVILVNRLLGLGHQIIKFRAVPFAGVRRAGPPGDQFIKHIVAIVAMRSMARNESIEVAGVNLIPVGVLVINRDLGVDADFLPRILNHFGQVFPCKGVTGEKAHIKAVLITGLFHQRLGFFKVEGIRRRVAGRGVAGLRRREIAVGTGCKAIERKRRHGVDIKCIGILKEQVDK